MNYQIVDIQIYRSSQDGITDEPNPSSLRWLGTFDVNELAAIYALIALADAMDHRSHETDIRVRLTIDGHPQKETFLVDAANTLKGYMKPIRQTDGLWKLRSSQGSVFFEPATGVVVKVVEGHDIDSPASTDPLFGTIYAVDVERAKADGVNIGMFMEADILYVGYWLVAPNGVVMYEEPLSYEDIHDVY